MKWPPLSRCNICMPDSLPTDNKTDNGFIKGVKFALRKFLQNSSAIEAEVKLLKHEAEALETDIQTKKIKKVIDTLPYEKS